MDDAGLGDRMTGREQKMNRPWDKKQLAVFKDLQEIRRKKSNVKSNEKVIQSEEDAKEGRGQIMKSFVNQGVID